MISVVGAYVVRTSSLNDQIETEYVTYCRERWLVSLTIAISNKNEFASDNIRLIKILENISTIIQFATLLAEYRFFLELTIYGVYLLEMALKDGIVVLYVTFQAFRRLTANVPL